MNKDLDKNICDQSTDAGISLVNKLEWKNKFIPLSLTLPEYLLSCQTQQPSISEIRQIKARIGGNPVCLEIGSGSGQHILTQAQQNPQNTYIGIEIRYKRAYKTAEKAKKRSINNLYIIRCDAQFLESFLEPAQVSRIFINFPDPWDRRRWKKHRLTAPEYLDRYYRLLANFGVINFKTDHQGLYNDTKKILENRTDYQLMFFSEQLHQSEKASNNVMTEFEQLFKAKNMPIYCLEFVKN